MSSSTGNNKNNFEYGTWLNNNCTQLNNWIVINSFNDIFNHSTRKFYDSRSHITPVSDDESKLFVHDLRDLGHIYTTYMSSEMLITIIKTRGKTPSFYLIKNKTNIKEKEDDENVNENENEENENVIKLVKEETPLPEILSIDSNVYKLNSLGDIVNILSGAELKLLGINKKKFTQCDISTSDLNKHIKLMTYAGSESIEEYITHFTKSFKTIKNGVKLTSKTLVKELDEIEILDLTGNYSITSNILSQLPVQKQITQIVLNKNHQLENFEWLRQFPSVQLIDFRYMNNLTFEHMSYITTICKDLKVVNLHFCGRVNLRILIPILRLQQIEKICIDDENFWCQKGAYELFIKPEEWDNIDCLSLKTIAINSLNMTLDVMDYIIKACPALETFLIDTEVFNVALKNVVNGYSSETIVLVPWQNTQKGVQLHRKIKFKNMFKDNYNSKIFTDSFTKTIEQQDLRRQQMLAEIEAELDAEEQLNENETGNKNIDF